MRSRVCRHSLARGNNIADKIPSDLSRRQARIGNQRCMRASDRCSQRGHRSISAGPFPVPPQRPRVTHAVAPVGMHHCHDASGSNAPNKWLENKMNSCLLWNSSKLSSGRETETPRNKSRRSNMLSHPRKLLSSSMDGAGKIFYHPARLTQQHIKPARTVGAVRDADGASGLAACRRSDCDRNADCRQDVLRTRQHRCSAGRATGCDA